jgi:esterase
MAILQEYDEIISVTIGMRLHFHVSGEGFPFILLHGFLGSLDNWRATSKRLGSRYQVYSLDLRNHGSSPHSGVMNYPVMARDVCEFMNEQRLPAAFVLGHSMGGKVAMQFATDFPNRVEKLIVVDITPKEYQPMHRPILNALLALDLKTYKSFGEVDTALAAAVREVHVRQFLLKNLTRGKGGQLGWRIHLEAIAENYDDLTTAISPQRKFDHPVCFIRGGRSNYIEESDVSIIREAFPQAKIRTIVNAGHWVHVDAAEEFLRIVTDFLTDDVPPPD